MIHNAVIAISWAATGAGALLAQATPPAAAAQSGPAWLRTAGLALLGLALVSAAVVLVRKLIARMRRRREDEELLPLVFPLKSNNRPHMAGFPPGKKPEPMPMRPPPLPPIRPVQSELVRMPRPAEGTLQLLPGRLEITSGNDRMKEIRFVKTQGPSVVTFGRYAGEPHTHVQIDSPTVSRMHASMRFAAGFWHIKNLSETNPVAVNGQSLPDNGEERVLNDGDQVEMGEVVFLFRSR
jgi:hypothetical protein